MSLRSPIEQIRRSSYALFRLLNSDRASARLGMDNHHWGNRKMNIRNLIVLMQDKPKEEFQHVKVLTLAELIPYIRFFQPSLMPMETRRVSEYLLDLDKRGTIALR